MTKKAFSIALASTLSFYCLNASAQFDPVKIATRFGELRSGENSELKFKGKKILPEVSVFSEAYVLSTHKLESADVVLISQAAGTACPGQFVFVTVSAEGAKATPVFGTCYDDDVKAIQTGETIAFSMKKLGGKGSSRYIYERGVVFENGKPIK